MVTTPPSGRSSPERRYPEIPPRTWTDEEIEAWIARVTRLKADIVGRRGPPLTTEELDEALQAVREGRD